MTDAMRLSGKSGMAPALGAAGFTVLAVGISLGILVWRGGAQREILDAESARCIKADLKACDVLRNQCLKRNAEACESLASSIWQSGPNRDLREAMRLYSDACQMRDRNACVAMARKLMEGDGVPKDEAASATLLDRGCELGAKEACALRETLHP
jgi:TPR repeat protein